MGAMRIGKAMLSILFGIALFCGWYAVAADYDYRTITDSHTGESVASSEHRPNAIILGSESSALGDLGDGL